MIIEKIVFMRVTLSDIHYRFTKHFVLAFSKRGVVPLNPL